MGTGTKKVPEPGIFHSSGGIGTGIVKIWYQKKVSEPVSVKFGTGKSLGTGIGKKLVPEKVPVSVLKIFGTGKKYSLTFWVPSHTDIQPTLCPNKSTILSVYIHVYSWCQTVCLWLCSEGPKARS